MTAATADFSAAGRITLAEAEDFIFTEAALADDHQYDDWEALWSDNGVYWVPAVSRSLADPDSHVSVVYDNRSRIALRVAQLKTGKRHAQDPVSSITRVISNIRLLRADPDSVETRSSFIAVESRIRGLTTCRPAPSATPSPGRGTPSACRARWSCSSTVTSRSRRWRS